jgi:hypothetical protein
MTWSFFLSDKKPQPQQYKNGEIFLIIKLQPMK